jgi:hypothetical protein
MSLRTDGGRRACPSYLYHVTWQQDIMTEQEDLLREQMRAARADWEAERRQLLDFCQADMLDALARLQVLPAHCSIWRKLFSYQHYILTLKAGTT